MVAIRPFLTEKGCHESALRSKTTQLTRVQTIVSPTSIFPPAPSSPQVRLRFVRLGQSGLGAVVGLLSKLLRTSRRRSAAKSPFETFASCRPWINRAGLNIRVGFFSDLIEAVLTPSQLARILCGSTLSVFI